MGICKWLLDKYFNKLQKRSDKGVTPYHLRSCAYLEKFEKPKIIYPETTVRRSEFVYDNEKMYLDKTCFFIDGKDLKYLNALLNSQSIKYYLESNLRVVGKTTIQYSKQYIVNLPIPNIPKEQQKPFINLVDTIINAKEKIAKYKKHYESLNAVDKIEIIEEVEKLESLVLSSTDEIDSLVYGLYELSLDEVNIIEDKK